MNIEEINIPEGTDLNDLIGKDQIEISDFYSVAPENKCLYVPTGALWQNSAVDARIPPVPVGKAKIKPSAWLAQNRSVEQVTWFPGKPQLMVNQLMQNGSVINHPGCTTFNLYQPPTIALGDPDKADPWLDLTYKVYPENANHLLDYFAHCVQRPWEKINHALALLGSPGIGKDSILESLRRAVGSWNFNDITPDQSLGRFRGFLKSVILRVNEARDLGDVNRYGFYEHMKIYTASPPDTLLIDEKNRREYSIPNVCAVVMTSNHLQGGLYLPPDDRRHYVAWSEKTKDDFSDDYWRRLWHWYENGGYEHVAAFLHARDLSGFDPKAPPEKTPAWQAIVDANQAPEDSELIDAIEKLGEPEALTIKMVMEKTDEDEFELWLLDRRNSRLISHRFDEAGYVPTRNPNSKDGRWKLNGKKTFIYAKKELPIRDRIKAATDLKSSEEDLS